MKRILLVLGVLTIFISAPALAADRSVIFQFYFGYGASQKSDQQNGWAIRYRQDEGEVHFAHWSGKRRNDALGLGLYLDTEGSGERGNDDLHAGISGGVSYVFKKNSRFYRHWQPYYSGFAGIDLDSDGDSEFEISYNRYGLGKDRGEKFIGFGLRQNDREDYNEPLTSATNESEEPIDPPCEGEDCGGEDPPPNHEYDDGNNGHGNDDDCFDEENPGNSNGCRQ